MSEKLVTGEFEGFVESVTEVILKGGHGLTLRTGVGVGGTPKNVSVV